MYTCICICVCACMRVGMCGGHVWECLYVVLVCACTHVHASSWLVPAVLPSWFPRHPLQLESAPRRQGPWCRSVCLVPRTVLHIGKQQSDYFKMKMGLAQGYCLPATIAFGRPTDLPTKSSLWKEPAATCCFPTRRPLAESGIV